MLGINNITFKLVFIELWKTVREVCPIEMISLRLSFTFDKSQTPANCHNQRDTHGFRQSISISVRSINWPADKPITLVWRPFQVGMGPTDNLLLGSPKIFEGKILFSVGYEAIWKGEKSAVMGVVGKSH